MILDHTFIGIETSSAVFAALKTQNDRLLNEICDLKVQMNENQKELFEQTGKILVILEAKN